MNAIAVAIVTCIGGLLAGGITGKHWGFKQGRNSVAIGSIYNHRGVPEDEHQSVVEHAKRLAMKAHRYGQTAVVACILVIGLTTALVVVALQWPSTSTVHGAAPAQLAPLTADPSRSSSNLSYFFNNLCAPRTVQLGQGVIASTDCLMFGDQVTVRVNRYSSPDERIKSRPTEQLASPSQGGCTLGMHLIEKDKEITRKDGRKAKYTTYLQFLVGQNGHCATDGKIWLEDEQDASVATIGFGNWSGPALQGSFQPLKAILSELGYQVD